MKEQIKKALAIEANNRKRLLKINSELDDRSGIYFLLRTDENGINYAYIGQARHILKRLAQHLSGYQHIDLSLKKHGFLLEGKEYGWRLFFEHCSIEELDAKEKHYIKMYALKGYQLRNKTAGGQGEGKQQIDEYRPTKGYRDGINQGKITLARDLKHIIDTHLVISLKKPSKVSEKALEKFYGLLDEETYKEGAE